MTETVVSQRNTVAATGFSNPLNLAANAEEASHVKVYGDDVLLQIGVDYTLAGVGDTGNLDAIAGVDVLIEQDTIDADLYETFTVEHDPPFDQGTDISSGGTLGRIYEGALDAMTRRLQALGSQVARVLRLPVDVDDGDVSVVLPLPEDRRALVWVQDQETGAYSLENTTNDPDTEPLTAALAAQAAAEAAQAAAEAAEAEALAQAIAASDSADRAEVAAANAGDLSALLNYLWPVGAKLEHFGPTAPANFLACDGSAVSRTTYSALFDVIGTTYGAGNGSTTFNLPKFDDGRFTRATGGNAAAQGALQAEMIGPHTHDATTDNSGAHSHTYGPKQGRYGDNDQTFAANDFRPSVGFNGSGTEKTLTTTSNGDHSHSVTVSANSGTENRPRNSSVLVCIKY